MKKPVLILVSTAGVQIHCKPRALPLLYLTIYCWPLAKPHADKVALEESFDDHMRREESQRSTKGYILVRPSIINDGKAKGVGYVRAGPWESPPVGYYVERQIIGKWIFKMLVEEKDTEGIRKNKEAIRTY